MNSALLRWGMAGMLVGAAAFAIFVGLMAAVGRSWAAPVMVAAVLLLGTYYVRVVGVHVGLVATLIVTSVVDHFTFAVGSLALRPEQVATFVALVVLAAMKVRERSIDWLKPSRTEIFLLGWFGVGILSSLLASPDRLLSAKILTLTLICSLGLFLPRRLLAGPHSAENIEAVTLWLLLVFATESAYGSIAYLLHVFGPTIGLTPNPASGHLTAYGTLWEQNVFGAFAAAGTVAWVYLGPKRFKWAAIGLTACLGGLFDSLTRAAWLVAVLVGVLGVVRRGLRRQIDMRTVGLGSLGSLVVVAATIVADRIASYSVFESGGGGSGGRGQSSLLSALLNVVDLTGRLNQWAPVWSDIDGRLAIGRGTASFEALHVIQAIPQHVASLPLLVFNDTGIVGVAVFGGFVAAVVTRVWSTRTNPIVGGLGQAAIVVALTNLATETTELMVGWLLIGILLAACDVASTLPPERLVGEPRGPSDVRQSNL
jgi:hypothetical protein